MKILNVDIKCALKLVPIFRAAGLSAPRMMLHANVESGPNAGIYELLERIALTIQRRLKEAKANGRPDFAVNSLAVKLRKKAVKKNSTLISPMLVGAWTRKA